MFSVVNLIPKIHSIFREIILQQMHKLSHNSVPWTCLSITAAAVHLLRMHLMSCFQSHTWMQFLMYSQSAGHVFVATHPFCYWRGMGQPCMSQPNLHISRLAQLWSYSSCLTVPDTALRNVAGEKTKQTTLFLWMQIQNNNEHTYLCNMISIIMW